MKGEGDHEAGVAKEATRPAMQRAFVRVVFVRGGSIARMPGRVDAGLTQNPCMLASKVTVAAIVVSGFMFVISAALWIYVNALEETSGYGPLTRLLGGVRIRSSLFLTKNFFQEIPFRG